MSIFNYLQETININPVDILINGQKTSLIMKLGAGGEAYFESEKDIKELKENIEKDVEETEKIEKVIPQATTAEKAEEKVKAFDAITPPAKIENEKDISKPKENRNLFRKIFDYFSRSKQSVQVPAAAPIPIIDNNGKPVDKGKPEANLNNNDYENEMLEDEDYASKEGESESEDSAEIELSLCGHRIYGNDQEEIARVFQEGKVPYEEYSNDPLSILQNPNLLIRFEDKLYEWKAAAPLILSLLAYKKPLPYEVMQLLTTGKKPQKKDERKPRRAMAMSKSPRLDPQNKPTKLAPHSNPETPNLKGVKPLHVMIEEFNLNQDPIADPMMPKEKAMQNFLHTKEPTSDQLKALRLVEGPNDIEFIVDSGFQGKQSVKSRVYLWDWKSKVVISDIDGTITKSDVFGQLMPMIGKDWSHPGVVSLYNNIEKNGYKLLYLSSRAIGLADLTRSYLDTLQQDNFSLPKGPLIISPDRLAMSFEREVISKKPQRFKVLALRKVRELFPHTWQPFVAGFGNRDTDLISYRAVGVDLHRIFIINPEGIVQLGGNSTYDKSYPLLYPMADLLFPPLTALKQPEDHQYNDLAYWKPFVGNNKEFALSKLASDYQ